MKPPIHTFKPKAPWYGGDLQTLRNTLLNNKADLSAWASTQLSFNVKDGSDDRLFATLNWHSEHPRVTPKSRVLVVLIHGMSGCEDSHAMLNSARFFLEQGFSTLRLNLRGAGRYRAHAKGTYHAGRSEDLHDVLASLPDDIADHLFIVGHSLGGNMLIKAMSELNDNENLPMPIKGAASWCAPIDMMVSQLKFSRRRNYVYQQSILKSIKASLSVVSAKRLDRLQKIAAVKNLSDLDDNIVAPSIGLRSAEEYYTLFSAIRFMPDVKVPMLISTSADDPWVSVESYLDFDWSQNTLLKPAISNTGGHCGGHEQGYKSTWFDRQVLTFLDTLFATV